MTTNKHAALPEILADLKALAGELRDDTKIGDDGIPVLTTVLASPVRVGKASYPVGAAAPTLSIVAARPERDIVPENSEEADALSIQIRARALAQRVDVFWREAGNSPLLPAMMAALELALVEALQNSP
jgi:hypothetical protein